MSLVVQNMNNTIHRINLYVVDNTVGFPRTYLLDSDLSGATTQAWTSSIQNWMYFEVLFELKIYFLIDTLLQIIPNIFLTVSEHDCQNQSVNLGKILKDLIAMLFRNSCF